MDVRTAASDLLTTLDNAQRKSLGRPALDDVERRNWHYTPEIRDGLSLNAMQPSQRLLTTKLLASVLSLQSVAKTNVIMALEAVLDTIEGGDRARDPGDYHLWFFGLPTDEVWAWRFEGHHVSLNFAMSRDDLWATPLFFGANPAQVTDGLHLASAPLRAEREVAVRLLHSFDQTQMSDAVISGDAPADILSTNAAVIDPDILSGGLGASSMRPDQVELLSAIVEVYVGRLADRYVSRPDVRELSFAWAGDLEAVGGHYYRVWGQDFLAEYDNTQNDANHIHSVWRDPRLDWGGDPFRQHLQQHHGLSR